MNGGDNLNLKEVREIKNISQQELADAIKRDRTLITKLETKEMLPSVRTAKAIASVLGFDWTLFFNKVGEELSHETTNKEAIISE
jgi:putative transcriptional regulator